MEEIKYYELDTKQEVRKENIESGKTYIEFKPNERWKVRLVVFENGIKISESLLTSIEEEKAKMEILKQKFIKMGYDDIKIMKTGLIEIDGIAFNIPNYQATVSDKSGKSGNAYFNINSLENIVQNNSYGKSISISDIEISDTNIINRIGNERQGNKSTRNNIVINYDQWGCKGTISLADMPDIQSFFSALNNIPRNKKEALERNNGKRDENIK